MIHIVRTTETSKIEQLSHLLTQNDKVILMDDACYLLSTHYLNSIANKQVTLFALDKHVSARNICVQENTKIIANEELVDILANETQSMTWQ